jgi:hypothetical protein
MPLVASKPGAIESGSCHLCDHFVAEVRQSRPGRRIAGIDLPRRCTHPLRMNVQSPTPYSRPEADEKVAFDRRELGAILGLYGRMVAAGEWRDYAMSFLRDAAVFAVFRHTAEHPLYRIEKRPKLRAKQGEYAVIGMDGRILKRGHDLITVLRVLERKLIRAVE